MNSPDHTSDDDALPAGECPLDALWIHGLLRGSADPADARAARLERFALRLQVESQAAPRLRLALVGAALAASVLVGVLAVFFGSQAAASASAAALVKQAQDAYRLPVDRRYHVRWEGGPGLETLSSSREAHLWTRGDRFWLELNGRVLGCGRDERGDLWVARTRQVGIRFDAAEAVPSELAVTCSICTMQLETLLGDVLRDFDLACEAPGDQTDSIHAVLKPQHQPGSVKEAWLEIDRRTHVVRRLVLSRNEAIVTYTLIETRSIGNDQYKLQGHLDPTARIYTRSRNPEMRRRKLLDPAGGSEQP